MLLLGYFDVIDATGEVEDGVRTMLVASIIALAIVFAGIVVFQTLMMV